MMPQDLVRVLESQDYKFAKSMPEHPHWYTLRENWTDQKLFDDTVQAIRNYGYTSFFHRKKYIKFNANGFEYWTMGSPIDETILINRAEHSYFTMYDDIAEEYASMFQDADSKQEERELFKLLDIKGSVLDVGCGTGLFLEHYKPERYLGIDISKNMLQVLKLRHTGYADSVLYCSAEDFYTDKKFDTIVSLFGSISYVKPYAVERLKTMLAPKGKAYFMFYDKTYKCFTHEKTGIHPEYFYSQDQGTIFNGKYNLVTYENI